MSTQMQIVLQFIDQLITIHDGKIHTIPQGVVVKDQLTAVTMPVVGQRFECWIRKSGTEWNTSAVLAVFPLSWSVENTNDKWLLIVTNNSVYTVYVYASLHRCMMSIHEAAKNVVLNRLYSFAG